VVNGFGVEAGKPLAQSKRIAKIAFTGETTTGRLIMQYASDNLIPVTLELGGKSPAILAPSGDLLRAAERIAVGKLMNAGQTCIAPDYALVPRAHLKAFADALGNAVTRCYPAIDTTPDYTTIVNARQFDRLCIYVDEAQAAGTRLVNLGGFDPDPVSRRFPPILLLDPPAQIAVMRDEIFGPILPVVPYDTLDEAITEANRLPFGLAGYAFTKSIKTAHTLGQKLELGMLWINQPATPSAEMPFGGVKDSGYGSEGGPVSDELGREPRQIAARLYPTQFG
jgi:acyl-CoA reductase-like NAD-dependent aldehyde dehydrogenase